MYFSLLLETKRFFNNETFLLCHVFLFFWCFTNSFREEPTNTNLEFSIILIITQENYWGGTTKKPINQNTQLFECKKCMTGLERHVSFQLLFIIITSMCKNSWCHSDWLYKHSFLMSKKGSRSLQKSFMDKKLFCYKK